MSITNSGTKIKRLYAALADIVRGELAENAIRKNFLPSEIDAIRRAMEPAEKAAATSRKVYGRSAPNAGETRDKIGEFAGVSGRTVEKIRDVVEAAESDPERFGHLVEEMDRTGKVTGSHRKLKQARDEEEVFSLTPVEGKHKTLIIDPPWDYDQNLAGRAAPGYATMTQKELLELPVPGAEGRGLINTLCISYGRIHGQGSVRQRCRWSSSV